VITQRDHDVLSTAGISKLDTSDFMPWPSIDFEFETVLYTINYSLEWDTFAIWQHGTDTLWAYKASTNPFTMKVDVNVPDGTVPPLSKAVMGYVAAIIKCDVRKLAPHARAIQPMWN
jgi:hypothetical protein